LHAVFTYSLVSGSGNLTVPLKFFPADPCCHSNEFWDKIDYNLAPVKDNCALFAPTPLYAAASTGKLSV